VQAPYPPRRRSSRSCRRAATASPSPATTCGCDRALRSINPSPYLFYIDYGSYHIFGSSPEAELLVEGRRATIHPIAGTYRRSGHGEEDARAVERLRSDPRRMPST
jgi:anthranilate/para-aminobenzoate synthase component I